MKFSKTLFFTLSVALTLCLAPSSFAGNVYVGGSFTDLAYKEKGYQLNYESKGFLAGYEFSDVFAIEGRYVLGDEDSLFGAPIELDDVVSLYGRLNFANETNVTPYVFGGYTETTLRVDGLGEQSMEGLSYGGGLAFDITDSFILGAEYTRLLDEEANGVDYKVESYGLNLIYSF